MKHLVVLLLGLLTSSLILPAQNRANFVPDEIIVKFTDGTTKELRQRVLDECMAVEEREFTAINAYHWLIPKALTLANGKTVRGVKEMQAYLELMPFVEYAEPNYLYHLTAYPNDTDYNLQWGPNKIMAPAAWDIETGDENVIVSIIDTGMDYGNIPDLVSNIWQNLGRRCRWRWACFGAC